MSRSPDEEWVALRQAISDLAAVRVPGWTGGRERDPGIALLHLLAFLLQELVRRDAISEAAAGPVTRVEDALSQLVWRPSVEVSVDGEPWVRVGSLQDARSDARVFALDETGALVFGDGEHGRRPPAGCRIAVRFRHGGGSDPRGAVAVQATWPLPARVHTVSIGTNGAMRFSAADLVREEWSGSMRPRYFDGTLLTAADLRDEQAYHLRKQRRHQATLHGPGVVNGLRVQAAADGTSVMIGRGAALDRDGRELYVSDDACVAVPDGTTSPAYVVLVYTERLVDPTPAMPDAANGEPAAGGGIGNSEATRIEEGSLVLLSDTVEPGGVAIARLLRTQQGWQVDTSYRPWHIGGDD